MHSTHYRYASPVSDSINDAHLCPVSDDFQQCVSFQLDFSPQTVNVMRQLDFYTNQVHHFEVMESHQLLEVVARSEVETFTDQRDFTVSCPPEMLVGLGRNDRYYDYLAGSQRVALSPMIQHEAKEIIAGISDVRQQVERVMGYIFEHFEYAPGTTHVESDVLHVFQIQRGVCQDFAHVMIGLCRSVGIPTRYVSGYFYVTPKSQSTVDNTASHAWVECYLPNIGWVGYDPTHDRRTDASYIKVAMGRDYVDVRPLAGTYRGKSTVEMDVTVSVQQLS